MRGNDSLLVLAHVVVSDMGGIHARVRHAGEALLEALPRVSVRKVTGKL